MTDYVLDLGITKETDNTLRWDTYVHDVQFSLYVPKAEVPSPTPHQIRVRILALAAGHEPPPDRDQAASPTGPRAVVARYKDHTKTVRYRPVGDPADWRIGEPYVPYVVLDEVAPDGIPDHLAISVEWM